MKTYKLRWIVLLLIMIAGKLQAYTERDLLQQIADLSKVRSSLVMEQQWVVYPDYHDRNGWNNMLGKYKQEFIQKGEKWLDYEWKVIKATDYIEFERSGNRRIMEDPFNSNVNAIADLLMAEMAEGEGRFIDQLVNGVFHCCEMTSWALSAHLVRQSSRRSLPDYKEHLIDLTSGDLSSLLAWTWYFLRDEFNKVNPVVSERLRHELQVRTLDPYMEENTYWWTALNYQPGMMVNNWNPWCNFNVLQCFLLLENDQDKLAEAVYRTMISVDKFINYTHSDGACEEGPSYWGHAAGKMYDYLQILYDGTDGKISLFEHPVIRNMGEYIARSYVGNGWVVNFADASAKGGGDARLIYRYAKAVKSPLMESYAGYLYHRNPKESMTVGRDLFRTLQNVLYEEDLKKLPSTYTPPAYSWYPETEFCYMSRPNGFFVAAKGGYNNESHNHNDAGTFSLYLNQTPIFIDAGVGTYTRQTFSSERYSIWTMQSNYHNIPEINGVPQSFGPEYKATKTTFNHGRMTFSADISTAYSNEAEVNRWIRSYTLEKKGLRITDSFDLNKTLAPNRIHFLVWGKIDLSVPGKVKVEVNGEKATLSYNKDQFSPSVDTITLDDPRLSTVWGKEVYRVTLEAKDMILKGSYIYTIEQHK